MLCSFLGLTLLYLLLQQPKDQQKKTKKRLLSKLVKVARGTKRKGVFRVLDKCKKFKHSLPGGGDKRSRAKGLQVQ